MAKAEIWVISFHAILSPKLRELGLPGNDEAQTMREQNHLLEVDRAFVGNVDFLGGFSTGAA